MKCPKCGSTDLEIQKEHNQLTCAQCGRVIEESDIVSELSFTSNSVAGQFVSSSGRAIRTARGFTRDSHELTLARAQREIQKHASNMKLSQQHAEAALRLYNLAQQKNFIQGRRSILVIAAALYIVCRQKRAPYLLIDFADSFGVDVFSLGNIYVKLVKLLYLQLPVIDPSLFIHRFCAKLDFNEKTPQVSMTALRIVQRMKRDWLSYGRRPTGLCGAAILIAARYHGFKRSTQQILQTVRVCNDTIRKRLEEFQNTSVASLTREEFESLNLESEELGESDPPSFKEIRFEPLNMCLEDKIELPKIKNEPEAESLSDISDNEIESLILTPEESALKSAMWHQENSDWLEKQKQKEQQQTCTIARKKRKRTFPVTQAAGPAEALKMSNKLPSRIDMTALEKLFKKEPEDYQYQSLLNLK